ncbi:MAG: hypothetical protein IJR85_03865 [Synergistaceae bacterium]|nr:hypothetical protein [Synergistaceae bacterium]
MPADQIKDKELASALIKYFEGDHEGAEEALENINETRPNPVALRVLLYLNTAKNLHKSESLNTIFWNLRGKDKDAFYAAFIDARPLIEFYAEKNVPSAQTIDDFRRHLLRPLGRIGR